jgi:hypothetical protein
MNAAYWCLVTEAAHCNLVTPIINVIFVFCRSVFLTQWIHVRKSPSWSVFTRNMTSVVVTLALLWPACQDTPLKLLWEVPCIMISFFGGRSGVEIFITEHYYSSEWCLYMYLVVMMHVQNANRITTECKYLSGHKLVLLRKPDIRVSFKHAVADSTRWLEYTVL